MKKLLVILLWGICFGASSQKAEVSIGKGADFSQLKTFRVEEGDLVTVARTEIDEASLKKSIATSIVDELGSKGYVHVQDSSAAMSVTFIAEIVETLEQENLGPLGQSPARSGADMDQSQTWTQEVKQGSMAIEIIDRSNNKTIWRSTSKIDFRSAELSDVMRGAVGRGLKKFPKLKK